MKNNSAPVLIDKFQSILPAILLILLGLWAGISLWRMAENALSKEGSNDLYIYWYTGHFIREGRDPYQAFLKHELPSAPVIYLDGRANSVKKIVQPEQSPAPAYTFPLVFILSASAFLTLPTMKVIWLIINIVLIAIIPFMIVRLLPKDNRPALWIQIALLLLLFGLAATRYTVSSGQITFFIFALMLAACLLADRHPCLAGILLGIAMSKYSLALGIFIFFLLIRPNVKMLLTTGLVQLIGVLGLGLISGSTPWTILTGYLAMMTYHARVEGIQLATLFPAGWDLPVAIVLTLGFGSLLALWRARSRSFARPESVLPAVTALCFWSLLVAYHRAYDAVLVILFFILAASVVQYADAWRISRSTQIGTAIFAALTAIFLLIPAGSQLRAIAGDDLGSQWVTIFSRATTLILLCGILISLGLLLRLSSPRSV